MGSDETAITIPGGPRVITIFDGERGAIGSKLFTFFGADRLRTPSGIGLVSDSRLGRMRRRLVLSRELWIENLGDLGSSPMAG